MHLHWTSLGTAPFKMNRGRKKISPTIQLPNRRWPSIRKFFKESRSFWILPTTTGLPYWHELGTFPYVYFLQVWVTQHEMESKLSYCLQHHTGVILCPREPAQSPQVLNKYVGGTMENTVGRKRTSQNVKKRILYTVSLLKFRLLPIHHGKWAFIEIKRF